MKYYTASQLSQMDIDGKNYSYNLVKRIIERTGLKPGEVGARGKHGYDLEEFKKSVEAYGPIKGKSSNSTSSKSLMELKEEKIKEEIHRLKQEKERADLEIEELKRTLTDTTRVKEFLLFRAGVELAIARRLFFIDIPVQLPGVSDAAKVRKITEGMFNQLQAVVEESITLWEREYTAGENKETTDFIQQIVNKLNENFQAATTTTVTT